MRIQSLNPLAVHSMSYLTAGAQGRVEEAQLPVLCGQIEGLPPEIEALICTGDLQGVVKSSDQSRLLGEVVAQELVVWFELQGIDPFHVGVLLTGDYFSAPDADRRGASGDVRPVWSAFLKHFRWVSGVAGNHDSLGHTPDDYLDFIAQQNVYFLDDQLSQVDEIHIAGICGIIGNPEKLNRRSGSQFLKNLERLKHNNPNLLVLHQSPQFEALGCLGAPELTAYFSSEIRPLTICGHVHWPQPLVELENGNQLLNVDSRAIILTRNGFTLI